MWIKSLIGDKGKIVGISATFLFEFNDDACGRKLILNKRTQKTELRKTKNADRDKRKPNENEKKTQRVF